VLQVNIKAMFSSDTVNLSSSGVNKSKSNVANPALFKTGRQIDFGTHTALPLPWANKITL